jgi:tRNA (guanine-N(7)-)-methyltransferase subunit TRM82
MPKRPIDLAIGPDNTIIAADKFGDVYTLPLIFDPTAPVTKSSSATAPAPKAKPSATTLTVHSKRNRIALEAQLQMYEAQKTNGGNKEATDPDAPTFEMDLILGHVSMLTAVELVESEGRRYILTADRDEHIRVSRYVPQAHVIECFCLGHKDFISSMVVPAGRGDILVSGGGDNDLFVWDWKTGAKLSTTSVLSLAQVVAPEVTKVAVSSLTTLLYPTENGALSYVLAICEE